MRLRPGLLAASLGSLIVAAAAAVAVAASAAGAPVVLIGSFDDEPLTGRIAAELRALGIGIEIRVVPTDESNIDQVVAAALRDGARAAVRVDARTGRTEVSIPDPATRQVTLKQLLEGPPTAALVPVLAVRTVEFVRATLLGPRSEDGQRGTGGGSAARDGASPDGELATGPSVAADLSMARLAGLRLSLTSGALFTPGGMSTTYTLGAAVRVRIDPSIGVEAMGFAPLSKGNVDGGNSAATSSAWVLGAGAFWHVPVAPRTGIELGAGGLWARLTFAGAPGPMLDAAPGSAPANAFSGYLRAGADLALAHNLALRLDLMGGVAVVRGVYEDQRSDTAPRYPAWPRTFAAALGGVEARWF